MGSSPPYPPPTMGFIPPTAANIYTQAGATFHLPENQALPSQFTNQTPSAPAQQQTSPPYPTDLYPPINMPYSQNPQHPMNNIQSNPQSSYPYQPSKSNSTNPFPTPTLHQQPPWQAETPTYQLSDNRSQETGLNKKTAKKAAKAAKKAAKYGISLQDYYRLDKTDRKKLKKKKRSSSSSSSDSD